MKEIKIIGRPEFVMDVDKETVDILIDLSEHHYDAVCRNASQRGGFLYGWRNMVSEPDPCSVHGTWAELDITLKICEMVNGDKTRLDKVWAYMKSVTRAMSVANQQEWETVVKL